MRLEMTPPRWRTGYAVGAERVKPGERVAQST